MQIGLCKSILNPDMAANAELTRFLEVSKARAVAVGLMAVGLRETLDAGRRNATQQEAVERTALHFKCGDGCGASVSWLVADTFEHLFRLDFLLLMVMLAKLLRAPCVPLEELLRWLRTGKASDCPDADAFYQMHANAYSNAHDAAECEARGLGFVDGDALMGGADRLMPCAHCMYLTLPLLRVSMKQAWNSAEGLAAFCEALAGRLHSQFAEQLQRQCQIEHSEEGREIIKAMLVSTVNRPFAWPSVLGSAGSLPEFWKGRAPPLPPASALYNNSAVVRDLARLVLPPLRLVGIEQTSGKLGVDLRWALLMSSLGDGQLAQAARFPAVEKLTQRFFQHCVPSELVPMRRLFTGLPSQVTGTGFLWPEVLGSSRLRVLRRPAETVGMDGFTRSRMVEDMAVAAPRYELAAMLKVDERDIPTDAVHYELPHGEWMPALLSEDHGQPGAVKWEDGRIWIQGEGLPAAQDVTRRVADEDGEGFLGGRSRVPIRPTCAFFRPGILVSVKHGDEPEEALGVVHTFRPQYGRYNALLSTQVQVRLTPYEVDAAVVLHGKEVLCRVEGIRCGRKQAEGSGAELLDADGAAVARVRYAARQVEVERLWPEPAVCFIGRLECQHPATMEALPRECIAVRMERAQVQHGDSAVDLLQSASHGDTAREHLDGRLAPFLCVHISGLLRLANDEDGRPGVATRCRALDEPHPPPSDPMVAP